MTARTIDRAPREIAVSADTFRAAVLSRLGVEFDARYAVLEYALAARTPSQVELATMAQRAIAGGDPATLEGLRAALRARLS